MDIRLLFLAVLLISTYSCQNKKSSNNFSVSKKDITPEAVIFLESEINEEGWDTMKNVVIIEEVDINDEFEHVGGTTIPPIYDLVIEQNLAPDQDSLITQNGDKIHYIITITNQGGFPSGKYKIENIVPAGCDLVSATPTSKYEGGIMKWDSLPELEPGDILELKYTIITEDPTLRWSNRWDEIEDDSEEDYGFGNDTIKDNEDSKK